MLELDVVADIPGSFAPAKLLGMGWLIAKCHAGSIGQLKEVFAGQLREVSGGPVWFLHSSSGWWQLKSFYFHPGSLGFHGPILTFIFFNWGWLKPPTSHTSHTYLYES